MMEKDKDKIKLEIQRAMLRCYSSILPQIEKGNLSSEERAFHMGRMEAYEHVVHMLDQKKDPPPLDPDEIFGNYEQKQDEEKKSPEDDDLKEGDVVSTTGNTKSLGELGLGYVKKYA